VGSAASVRYQTQRNARPCSAERHSFVSSDSISAEGEGDVWWTRAGEKAVRHQVPARTGLQPSGGAGIGRGDATVLSQRGASRHDEARERERSQNEISRLLLCWPTGVSRAPTCSKVELTVGASGVRRTDDLVAARLTMRTGARATLSSPTMTDIA